MNKQIDVSELYKFIKSNMRVLVGGFGISGSPLSILDELARLKDVTELEIELLPQGTLAETIRCAGAGIGGFYTKTAAGTKLSEGKEIRNIDGESYVFEKAIRGDIALIQAKTADQLGNLIYHTMARNFNPMMATVADIVIAEVDEIVEVGELDPENIIAPHTYVDYLVLNQYKKEGGNYVIK